MTPESPPPPDGASPDALRAWAALPTTPDGDAFGHPITPGGPPPPIGETPGGPASSARLRPIRRAAATGRIGPYAIEGELARGGMGIVYRGRHAALDRPVALKVMLAGGLATPVQRERFHLEARAAARLRHPNIVAIHDVGEENGCPFFAMDLIDGETLQARLDRDGPLPERDAASLIARLARALAYAHARAVLHRDVKPLNVLIGADGEPLLTDFGLAKDMDAGASGGPTVDGQMVGTPGYMPPEQASGRVDLIDRRSDVYSLGATLYALLTGDPPFAGLQPIQAIAAVIRGEPTPPSRTRSGLDRDLETICMKCVENEPARRYGSADELAADLDRWLANEPIRARPPTVADRLRKWTSRNAAVATVLTLASIVLIAGGVGGLVYDARQRAIAERDAAFREERARVEAAEAERRSLAARARGELIEAQRASEAAVDDPSPGGRLGRALGVLQAAQRWHAVEEGDARREAARALFESATALGHVALEVESWGLAEQAFGQAVGLGVDDDEAAELIALVERTRTAESRRRGDEIRATLALATSGELDSRADGFEDALFAIVRYDEPQTVAILARKLDEVAAALERATRDMLLGAATPTSAEARAGLRPIPGVEDLLTNRATRDAVTEEERARLVEVERRLQARARRRPTETQVITDVELLDHTSVEQLLGDEQERVVGRGELQAARLAATALGRLGIDVGDAVEALGRYLRAEEDRRRALPIAIALCRTGRVEAIGHIVSALRRHGHEGFFADAVGRHIEEVDVEAVLGEAISAEEHLDHAQVKILVGDSKGALAALDRALELDAGLVEALVLRSEVRILTGDEAGAIEDASRVLERSPGHVRALVSRGQGYIKSDRAKARADLERATELEPGHALAWYHLARAHARDDDHRAAIAALDRSIAANPENPRAWGNRGCEHISTGELDRALVDFDRSISLDPHFARSYFNRGCARWDLRDLDGALRDLDRAVELEPDVEWWVRTRGRLHGQRGEVEAAERDFGRALELHPESTLARRDRAELRLIAGNVRGGIEDLEALVAFDQEDAMAWTTLAMARVMNGQPAKAISASDRALKLAPKLAPAWDARAQAKVGTGDAKGAVADAERAVELAPGVAPYWNNLAFARIFARDVAGAGSAVARALALDPDLGVALGTRGTVRMMNGDHTGAIADFDQAIAENPGIRSRLLPARGQARIVAGDTAGAIADFDRALELDPRRPDSWAHRGFARYLLGRNAGALADAERALELRADLPLARSVRGVTLVLTGQTEAGLAECAAAATSGGQDEFGCQTILARALAETGDHAGSVAALGRALELVPDHAEVLAIRGVSRRELDDLEGAWADVERALELQPECLRARLERAELRHESGDDDGALSDVRAAEALAPNGEPLRWVGETLVVIGRPAEAAEAYARLLADSPNDLPTLRARAGALDRAGDLETARATYEHALELEPEDVAALRGLASLIVLVDPMASEEVVERLLELAPDDPYGLAVLAYAQAVGGRLGEAEATAARAVEADPKKGNGHAARSLIAYLQGDSERATVHADEAVKRGAGNELAFEVRALARLATAGLDAARSDAERALRLDRGQPWALAIQADVKLAAGDRDGALADATRAIEIHADNPLARRVRARILEALGRTDEAAADLEHTLETMPWVNEADDTRAWLERLRGG